MAVDWTVVRDQFKGQLVGGELIVRQSKVNHSCGRLKNGVFNWTPFGLQLAESVIPPRPAPMASPLPTPEPTLPKRRPGRPRKVKAVEVPVDAEAGN